MKSVTVANGVDCVMSLIAPDRLPASAMVMAAAIGAELSSSKVSCHSLCVSDLIDASESSSSCILSLRNRSRSSEIW
eukprot:7388567-Ditylum_brightwellii.AAC.1